MRPPLPRATAEGQPRSPPAQPAALLLSPLLAGEKPQRCQGENPGVYFEQECWFRQGMSWAVPVPLVPGMFPVPVLGFQLCPRLHHPCLGRAVGFFPPIPDFSSFGGFFLGDKQHLQLWGWRSPQSLSVHPYFFTNSSSSLGQRRRADYFSQVSLSNSFQNWLQIN